MKNKLGVLLDAANFEKTRDTKLTVNKIRNRIFKAIESKGKKPGDGFDMEPFEILRDIIRNDEDWAIGGTPQIVKIFKHMKDYQSKPGIFEKQKDPLLKTGNPPYFQPK